jgi:glucokinase
MILAGDVGGTKVHLALYSFEQGEMQYMRDEVYPAKNHAGLEEIVNLFLAEETEPITAACFGVPGPVRNGRLKLTNLPWLLDSRELSLNLKIEHVFLINDLEANGYGIAELRPEQFFVLSEGDTSQMGNRGLVSPGTGLGEAFMIWNGKSHLPIASEGGHCDFAPRNEEEINLLRFLQQKHKGRVSFERVVSGMGLTNIYEYLRDGKKMEEPKWLREQMQEQDPNKVIAEFAMNGESEICAKALDMFVSATGAEAGNMALEVLAIGGMYIGGGIAPRILTKLQDGSFMKAFTDKGRLSQLLVNTPVRVILESRAALLGAASYAEARAAEISGISPRAASVQFS